jgi:hypothetical protein
MKTMGAGQAYILIKSGRQTPLPVCHKLIYRLYICLHVGIVRDASKFGFVKLSFLLLFLLL